MKNVLDDIFSCQHGNVFAEGLVDANSEDEFDKKLETLQERWKARKKCSYYLVVGSVSTKLKL